MLPDAFVGRLQEVKTAVDFLLLFSLLSLFFALLSVPYLPARAGAPRSHRKAPLRALGLRTPETLTQERALWREVSDFIFRGILPDEDWKFDAHAR